MKTRESSQPHQLTMDRLLGHRAEGGGRKKNKDSGVPHLPREGIVKGVPVHVTTHLVDGLPDLRVRGCMRVIREAFARSRARAGSREDGFFRLTDYSVQGNHLHLIVEAGDADALGRGLNGMFVRIAKGLNKLWKRKGKLFRERYHARVLRTPRQVYHALRYVLHNARRHGRQLRPGRPDPFSSGPWFEGWADYEHDREGNHGADGWLAQEGPIARATSWLRRVGWRRYGLLRLRPA